MKQCPHHDVELEQAIIANVEVDYCPVGYGLWFEENELQWAKDEKDKDLRWLDIDLWRDISAFRLQRTAKLCPVHRLPMYEVEYGDSGIKVDVCSLDRGIWLDRGEFRGIIQYLKDKANTEVLDHYLKNVLQETWELFSGPELLKEEATDLLTILKLMQYKFSVQHPRIAEAISRLPK